MDNIIREENVTGIMILSAGKGNASVVMDKFEYSETLIRLVGAGSCSRVKKDPILMRW